MARGNVTASDRAQKIRDQLALLAVASFKAGKGELLQEIADIDKSVEALAGHLDDASPDSPVTPVE